MRSLRSHASEEIYCTAESQAQKFNGGSAYSVKRLPSHIYPLTLFWSHFQSFYKLDSSTISQCLQLTSLQDSRFLWPRLIFRLYFAITQDLPRPSFHSTGIYPQMPSLQKFILLMITIKQKHVVSALIQTTYHDVSDYDEQSDNERDAMHRCGAVVCAIGKSLCPA